MSKHEELHPTLKTALHLDGSADSVKEFYADWAGNYDNDTLSWDYAAPTNASILLGNVTKAQGVSFDGTNKNIKILDAGCGTGLLALILSQAGYTHIDGFDLSDDMVKIARKRSIYRNLQGNVNINEPVSEEHKGKYDCTISIGVFTPGHVPPESLERLVEMTRPSGIVIVSTRIAYYESENYQSVANKLETEGKIKLINSLKDSAYTTDEKAHYWVYLVTN